MGAFKDLLAKLKRHYGEPPMPPARGPFELVMWENACYLRPDERRAEVFESLRTLVGLTPEAILNASRDTLFTLAQAGGMRPETRVFRWREIARITIDQFAGDLSSILVLPPAQAKKALKQFPNIGDPGAEKILMFCGTGPDFPLESNGLRVLTRFGFGRVQKNYGAMYKSAQEAIRDDLPRGAPALARAHLLLRQHGKTLCKTNDPVCTACPLAATCSFGSGM